ncbi:GNAT family N-acetyltransferase [Mangrovicella endophytica]|uniref:GNAT family N-acetyltransferase n=1 Tax=Mangrovicella endophytica TaxID=2066697 RepID=UPI000C9DC263|nr:GNAT family N-acetyltransferase [Mangrovicella endophytica]
MIERARPSDADQIGWLMRLAFGMTEERTSEYVANLGTDAFFVMRCGGALSACAALLDTRHRFGGGWVPAANIAHIAIAPEARGSGLARPLVNGLAGAAAERGAAMVSLFASARPVYRKCGFELAGSEIVYEAETAALPAKTEHSFRSVALDDPALRAAYDAKTQAEAGLLDRAEAHWHELLRAPRQGLAAFGAGEAELSAYAIIDASDPNVLIVRDWFAATGAEATSLLAFFGRFRSVYPLVRWHGGPHDDLVAAMPDKGWRLLHQEEWLARILDPKAALEARGYVVRDATLNLSIREDGGGQSDLILDIAGGRASVREGVEPGAPGVAVRSAFLSSLFTGFRSASHLQRQGHLAADADGTRLADLVFAGPPPWLAEHV